jgi:hypothetical protein
MPRRPNSSRGEALTRRLQAGRQEAQRAPLAGARDIVVLEGLSPACTAVPLFENILARAQEVLVESGRIYRYGNGIVMEVGSGTEAKLVPLTVGSNLEASAAPRLANFFICESRPEKGAPVQFPPPSRFVSTLLTREPTLASLPAIAIYALRPVFDENFQLRGPGWHEEVGILVHGFDVEPVLPDCVDPDLPAIERLPPYLGRLLGDFCFKEDADVANTVAVLITGLAVTNFITNGKPVVLLDGNQPGLGKTLLVRVIGMVLDGVDPRLIHYTVEEEELQKRICATLRGGSQSQLLIDNAKGKAETAISSPVIEANSMAAEISLRILGKSENYTRPNDVLWYITMNNTKASSDLVSRGLPIRQHYEGDPGDRDFGQRNPLRYAREHRQEILGELAGMIVRWNQRGRPDGHQNHRLTEWAKILGGVMCVNGFPEFLTNLHTAAAEFNTALDELAALAEAAISANSDAVVFPDREGDEHGNET